MKNYIAFLLGIMLAACLFVSCSDGNEEKTFTGEVVSVSESRITLSLGEAEYTDMPSAHDDREMPEGEKPEGMPEMPEEQVPEDMPEKPEGQAPENMHEKPEGQAPENMPEKPEGQSPENMPEMSDGQMPGSMTDSENIIIASSFTPDGRTETVDAGEADLSGIKKGDIISVVFDANGKAEIKKIIVMDTAGSMQKSSRGMDSVNQGNAATEITENKTFNESEYVSSLSDENALRVKEAEVSFDSIKVIKTGDASDSDAGNFYGLNAGVLATEGASVAISNSEISTSAEASNGIHSYGEDTSVNISDSTVITSGNSSGGIMATGGGTLNAVNVCAETSGSHSAAIRSDRGGCSMNVEKGRYVSKGTDSPAVYSTGNITVSEAELKAMNSEALVIEGGNSIILSGCTAEGSMSEKGSSASEGMHNIMIYQSMSGDADEGKAYFSADGCSIVSNHGNMFYITNTECTIELSDNNFENRDSSAHFMEISGNSFAGGWGQNGSNGGNVVLRLTNQTVSGDILVDSISTLDMTLSGGSVFSGAVVVCANEEGGSAVADNAVITVEKGCTWNLTGNCTVSALDNKGKINFNGYTITLADGTVLRN